MSMPNEHKTSDREVRQSYNDANGHTHTNVTRTTETVNNRSNPSSYQDGYVHGLSERRYQQERLAERDNDNAARGLLLGIVLTTLAALTAGTLWFLNQRNEAPVPVTPLVVPNSQPDPKPSPEANQAPEKQTTIIERTKEVLVPVPQQQEPAPQAPTPAPAPDTNTSVPKSAPQPPAAEAPSTQSAPTQPQSQKSSVTDRGTQSSTDNTTAEQAKQRNTNQNQQSQEQPASDSSPAD